MIGWGLGVWLAIDHPLAWNSQSVIMFAREREGRQWWARGEQQKRETENEVEENGEKERKTMRDVR